MFWTGDTRCECFGSVPVLFAVVRSQPRHTADCDLVVAEAVAAVEHTTAGHHVNLVTHGDHGHPETYLYDALAERFDGVAYEYVEQCGCGGHVTRVYVE